jgi:ketosteroid isomerase-like protein
VITAEQAFAQMRSHFLDGSGAFDADDLAEDVVIETPFSPPGMRRVEGRDTWLEFATAQRAALPIRIEDCRPIALHTTTDPGVMVMEYELTALSTVTGRRDTAAFIGVLEVRDGKTVLWREYQNMIAMAQGMGTLPQLLEAYQRSSGLPSDSATDGAEPNPATAAG